MSFQIWPLKASNVLPGYFFHPVSVCSRSLTTPLPGQLSVLFGGSQLHGAGAQAPSFLRGADEAHEETADVQGILYQPLHVLKMRRNVQMGRVSCVLLLLFPQQESLSSRGRKKEFGCCRLSFPSCIPSLCSWGHRDEQGGPSTRDFPSSCCSCRSWGMPAVEI